MARNYQAPESNFWKSFLEKSLTRNQVGFGIGTAVVNPAAEVMREAHGKAPTPAKDVEKPLRKRKLQQASADAATPAVKLRPSNLGKDVLGEYAY